MKSHPHTLYILTKQKIIYLIIFIQLLFSNILLGQSYYPVHATVQFQSPYGVYLSDYYSGSRDKLIITLYNRDNQQPLQNVRLRFRLKGQGFIATSREELSYPQILLYSNEPLRLTTSELTPYLHPSNLSIVGRLDNGRLPSGMLELSVQAVEYYTGQPLSSWHSGRAYIELNKPPLLNVPVKDESLSLNSPQYIRFQWYPRHQGVSSTSYEFVLKELPDNGVHPQSSFLYGNEIYRTETRSTTLLYTHQMPDLLPNKVYAWQVRAISTFSSEEINFENEGCSEVWWFSLRDNIKSPSGLRSVPRYAKVDLSWNRVSGSSGYVVSCRPKTSFGIYEWSTLNVNDDRVTISQLHPGWTYEWKVGTLSFNNSPVYSEVAEFTLSKNNEELLADCGKTPVREDLSQEPNTTLRPGDVVIIGGDYPMTVISSTHLGDGWYSGEGRTRLKSIIDAPLAIRFSRLRINKDNYQIDGTAEAAYDESKGKISDLDMIDDGGESIKESGGMRMREHSLDFVLPDPPYFTFNTATGELNVTDSEGVQQTVKIAFPENTDYNSIFPMRVTDSKGSTYQIEPDGSGIVEGEDGNGEDEANDSESSSNVQLKAVKIDETETFSPDNLELKYGTVVFEKGDGKYSFDLGTEKWYANSVKLDRFYTPFGRKYVSPWKFIPVGETDVVKARLEVAGKVNPLEIQFATKDRQTVPFIYDEVDGSWTLTLAGTDANTTYSVYAVYKGSVIGRMHVLSNPKKQVTLTLVPINSSNFNLEEIESQLNTIYGEVGVSVTLILKESLRGDYSWDIPDNSGNKDGKLSLTGESFWGYEKEMKESPEMKNLQTLFKEKEKDHSDSPVFFILDGAVGIDNSVSGLLGEMPRQSQFGYLFYTGTSETEKLSHTIAHELGHGLFTLQHTFDREYGKEKSRGTTLNLMDYGGGRELAAFQWNIMSSPAIFTGFDRVEDVEKKELDIIELLNKLREHYKNNSFYDSHPDTCGRLEKGYKFYKYIIEDSVFVNIYKKATTKVSFAKRDDVYKSDYNRYWHKIEISGVGSINCFSKKDRDVIYGFLTGENEKLFIDLYKHELESLNSITENTSEKIVLELIKQLNHPGLFSGIKLNTRINILSALLKEGVDDGFWEINDTFFLDKLIFSAPEEGRIRILKEFMKNNYRWLKILWKKTTGIFNNDVTIIDIIPLVTEMGKWIKEYYSELNIPITTYEIKDIGPFNVNSKYPVAAEIPICLGIPGDGSSFFYEKIIDGRRYALKIQSSEIKFEEGRIKFNQKFNGTLQGQYLTRPDYRIPTIIPGIETELKVSPFEPVYLIARRNYPDFGIKKGDGFFVPAFIAATYLQCLIDKKRTNVLRSIGNGIAIGAAGISIPYTGGGSWVAYTTIAAGVVAGLDEALASGRLKLGSSKEYDEKYKDFYQAWDALYFAVSVADIAVNTPRMFNYMRHINIAKASKNLYQKAKGLNNVALSGKVTNLFKNIKVTNFSKLEGNRQFLSILGRTKVKDIGAFKNKFTELHKLCKTNDVNSVKSLDDVIGDFDNLISHLSDKNQTQMVKFINEMLESSDKFKAAATTLEVVKNPQKYISIKNLTNLELEDLISTAEGAGKYRFDIKWRAKIYDNNGIGAKVAIFVDTKNYSKADNMFQDLKQFKAYLSAIDNFDQLHIVQQSRNGITLEKVIAQLEKAIAKDATGVYRAKSQLWMNMNIDSPEMLRKLAENKKLSTDPSYQAFRNIIKLTK